MNQMKIALITGASSGMGREFALQIERDYEELDELWLVGRREEKLCQVREELKKQTRIFPLDLTKPEMREQLFEALKKEAPQIKLLVNAAGAGVIGRCEQLPAEPQLSSLQINCEALTAVTLACLPFLSAGSRIIQLASASAFLPQPGFGVYAASKAYVLSFSRALRWELRKKGVSVTAVCPGPVDTPFFLPAQVYQKRPAGKDLFMAKPARVTAKALRDAAADRELSIYGLSMKLVYVFCKILPQSLIIRLWSGLNENDEETENDED